MSDGIFQRVLPTLMGTERQVEAADRIRAAALDPTSYGGNIRAVHAFMLPVVASGVTATTNAADWLDNKKYAFPLLFAGRFGIGLAAAKAAQRVVETKHSYDEFRRANDETPNPSMDDDETAELVAAVGDRAKAAEIATAFGFTLTN